MDHQSIAHFVSHGAKKQHDKERELVERQRGLLVMHTAQLSLSPGGLGCVASDRKALSTDHYFHIQNHAHTSILLLCIAIRDHFDSHLPNAQGKTASTNVLVLTTTMTYKVSGLRLHQHKRCVNADQG